jgi:hypothetical protein
MQIANGRACSMASADCWCSFDCATCSIACAEVFCCPHSLWFYSDFCWHVHIVDVVLLCRRERPLGVEQVAWPSPFRVSSWDEMGQKSAWLEDVRQPDTHQSSWTWCYVLASKAGVLFDPGDHWCPQMRPSWRCIRVRPGPLRSSACSWGPAGNTLILGLLFGSGWDHCDHELAVEVRRRRRRRPADIKSNNPHLTGGEWHRQLGFRRVGSAWKLWGIHGNPKSHVYIVETHLGKV